MIRMKMPNKLTISLIALALLAGLGIVWGLSKAFRNSSTLMYQTQESPSPKTKESPSPKNDLKPQLPEATIIVPPPLTKPRCQGKVMGIEIPREGNAKSFKQLLAAYPMPKMWLVFHQDPKDCNIPINTDNGIYHTMDVQLPKAATQLLKDLWTTACTYYYYEIFDKPDLNTQKERFKAMALANHNTAAKLTYLAVKTPDGKRNICMDEATALMRYVNDSAQTLVSNLYGRNKRETVTD